MNFSLNEKQFILWTKGYFTQYHEPEKVIIGDALHLYPEQVEPYNMTNYAIKVFDKLMQSGRIDGACDDPIQWMVNEMRQITRRLEPPTLYEFLIAHIQDSNVDGLDLNIDIMPITQRMALIQ